MERTFDLGCSFGIMQGRLSAQTDRGYQAFPWETWQQEFDIAAELGLEHVEWVLDTWRVQDNPILDKTREVRARTLESGVQIVSVCADYLMDRPLDASDAQSWAIHESLTVAMQELGTQWLVVPCVDQASLRVAPALDRFIRVAEPLAESLAGTGIRVALECDLGPSEFSTLLGSLDPEVFGVNYDIGNSSGLGYSHAEEFDAYGDRIILLHIKDRLFEGGSVPLGQGNADILGVIDRMRQMQFDGPVTMQAFRDIQGLDVLDAQLKWLQPVLQGN
jgi:L-ribulose-5-phosphate 3-epimerase